MNMSELEAVVVKTIEGYKANKIIMDFVTQEAREKVAAEIREKTKGDTSAKDVELLEVRLTNIKSRVESYVNAGLVACYIASLK